MKKRDRDQGKRPPYLHIFKDRHGKPRLYYRRPGRPRVPLTGPLYSDAFWKAYHAAEACSNTSSVATSGDHPGSISALIAAYYGSAEWKALAPSSRNTYRRQLERFRAVNGTKPVATLETRHVNRILDQMADRPASANNLRDRLNVLMQFAVSDGWREDNPITNAKRIKHVTKGYRSWSEVDISAFRKRWPIGTPQRLAMEILLHTGLRRSDAVRLGRQHVVDGTIFVLTTVKSQGRTELAIPIHPSLRPILATAPSDHLTYIVTAFSSALSRTRPSGSARSGKSTPGS
jgi:integrase